MQLLAGFCVEQSEVYKMNCNACQLEFDRLLDGQLDAASTDVLRNHLAACAVCASAWSDYQLAWRAFAASPELEPSSNFAARVMSQIDIADREAPANILPFPVMWRWATAAAAAMVVLSVSLSSWLHGGYGSDLNHELLAELPVVQQLDLLKDFDVINNLDQLAPPTDELDDLVDELLNS